MPASWATTSPPPRHNFDAQPEISSATPLLVVDTSHADFVGSDQALDDLIRQIRTMGRGTMYYVPRA